ALLRTKADLELARNAAAIKHSDSIALRCELNRCMKEDMEKEIVWMTKEENFRKTLLLRTTSFEQKANDFQRTLAEKDEMIEGLRRDLQKLQTAIAEASRKDEMMTESSAKKDITRAEDNASKALIEQLKRERNALEVTVAELKKQLETSPETLQEVKRLQKLLEEKDEKLAAMRRNYRQLMRKVEHSLEHLEKQHLKTRRKLEENIIS
ncbi:unnamed protein product, partial [Strongylus vulgaris]